MGPRNEPMIEKKQEQSEKKPYAKPNLIKHGDVEKITEYFGGQNTDAYGGSTPG